MITHCIAAGADNRPLVETIEHAERMTRYKLLVVREPGDMVTAVFTSPSGLHPYELNNVQGLHDGYVGKHWGGSEGDWGAMAAMLKQAQRDFFT